MRIVGVLKDISDWGAVGVIMWAGANWMVGNRTKAIEHFLGAAIGYEIILHAMAIRDLLKGV